MADAFTSETYDALCRDAEGYLARGLAEQARELLLKATSLIGTRARARSLLADACMQLTLWDEAKSQLEALATLEVDDIYTHFRLGQVLEETSDYELAIDNFRVVLDMNADHHGAKVAIARLEKLADASSSSEKVRPVEGQQIFADSDDENGIFAGESSQGIEELLNNIGMGEKADVPGVDDLLNSLGIHKEEKKEEKPKVDFSSIFGGSESLSPEATEEPQADLGAMFGETPKTEPVTVETEQPPADASADLSSMFGDSESLSPEATEEPQADLGAMFGETSKTEPVTVETEQPPADTPADLSSMFGGSESLSPEATEEPQADLGAMFGETSKTEPVTVETEQPPADLSSIFGGDDAAADTDSPSESDESTEASPEGVPSDSTESTEAIPEGVPSDSTESTEASPEGVPETVPEVSEEPQADLSAMFGETPKTEPVTVETEQPPADASADLSSIFGGSEAAVAPEATEEPQADLGAMFGETPKTEPVTVETEQPPADASADLSSVFGGSEAAAAPEATEEPQADLGAMFGETPKTEPVTVETEQPPADASADLSSMFGGSEAAAAPEATEEPQADLGAMFGETPKADPESTESSPESVPGDSTESTEAIPVSVPDDSTESTETSPEGVPSVSTESTEASPESVLGDSTESTEASPDSVPDDSTESTETSPEGVPSVSTETVPEVTEEPQSDLDAMFGETPMVDPESTEAISVSVPSDSTESTETSTEGVPSVSTESTETSPEGVPSVSTESTETSPEGVPSVSTESTEVEKSTTADLPVEITVEVPIVSEEKTEITSGEGVTAEPEEEVASSPDTPPYTLLPGDGNSLCIMKLENAKARVIRGLIVGMDGTVSLEGDVLHGDGLVWIGQGSLTPVVVKYQEGMTVRIDRLVVRPVQIVHEACGIGSVPSLCKLNGNGSNSNILMFVTGRLKKLSVSSGLRVLEGSVLVADPGVSFAEDASGFLSVTGEGTLIITG